MHICCVFYALHLLCLKTVFSELSNQQQHYMDKFSTNILSFPNFEEKNKLSAADHVDQIKPGTKAQNFQIWTLNRGLVSYPSSLLPENVPIGFHAYTNSSGFLECMWTNEQSLIDFVTTSPPAVSYVFMSFDSNAVEVVTWMQNQLNSALSLSKLPKKEQEIFLNQCFFVVTPVFEIGNWIASVLSDWSCKDHGCGLNQLVFHSSNFEQKPPILVTKRLDARYDWVVNHAFSANDLKVKLFLKSCDLFFGDEVNGSVALIPDDHSQCSIARQVYNLQQAGAAGVLVYSKPGYPLQDLNCNGSNCNDIINIPVASIHYNSQLIKVLMSQNSVTVSQQTTPYSNFYFTINGRGELVEPGWFLYPSMQFLAWQMQWLIFDDNLVQEISQLDDYIVTVFNHTVMQGKNGTGNVTIDLLSLSNYEKVYIDAALSCTSDNDEGCPPWDHVPQLFLCCEGASLCDIEIGRWITAFRRGIGHWLTDISPLLPLFSPSQSTSKCSFLMKTDAWWAQPWVATVILRFQKPKSERLIKFESTNEVTSINNLRPLTVIPLFEGGTFDKSYNTKYIPLQFKPTSNVKSVKIYAVITGHGSDNYGCGEFCVTSHTFVVNGRYKHVKTFSNAGTPLGCAERVPQGVVPNEHGTWLYGRDGWCDGQQVDSWVVDITEEVLFETQNNITYFGLFNGKDPNPTQNPGLIRLVSYLVYYTAT